MAVTTFSRIGNIVQTTAVTENTLQGRAVYVEDCRCPAGYYGTSCEVIYDEFPVFHLFRLFSSYVYIKSHKSN